jgi:hypothetical protein
MPTWQVSNAETKTTTLARDNKFPSITFLTCPREVTCLNRARKLPMLGAPAKFLLLPML